MLGKDLLRTKVRGDHIYPSFISTDDEQWLSLAVELLAVYENGIGDSAAVLNSAADSIVLKYKDLKLARGILKIIQDRTEFSGINDDFPYTEKRACLFKKTAEMLQSGTLPQLPYDVKAAVLNVMPDNGFENRLIYADLPENETLLRVKKIFPREVLERYNVGLVQGLLLTANAIHLNIPVDTPAADLRNLFRNIKFFQLLFSGKTEDDTLRITVDGPASILENSLKYGLQLACFFPSVCRLPSWKLSAEVLRNEKKYSLLLDQSSNLKSQIAQFSGTLEEYSMFANYFKKQTSRWEIDTAPGFLVFENQKAIFPDFAFRCGETVKYLELFHRWHASQFEERLLSLEAHPEHGLLLGVDKALLKKNGVLKSRIDDSSYFAEHGFFFHDFPGVENVLTLLERDMDSLQI